MMKVTNFSSFSDQDDELWVWGWRWWMFTFFAKVNEM